MTKIEQLKELVEVVSANLAKFEGNGNKTAGTRARQALQDVKKVAQDIRVEISEKKNA